MKDVVKGLVALLSVVWFLSLALVPASAAEKEAPRGKLDRSTISTCGEGNSVLKGKEVVEGGKPSRLLKTRCKGTAELALIASNPPNGAIDAREPAEPDGTGSYGWDTIELTFNASTSGFSPAEFVVTTTGEDTPSVVNVTSAGATAVLELDRPIPAGERTTISHTPSGSSICLGYLPGDVNSDGLVEAADIDALSACLTGNSSGTCEPWQTDINRSGSTTFADLLRVIDLYNGSDAFEIWEGQTLPATCPREELRADFGVFELVHVDPVTGEEQWREFDLENEEIEYGLRVKLDGTLSTGAAYYRWRQNGALIGTDAVEMKTYKGPTEFEISLTVYDATAQQTDTITKAVRVDGGMRYTGSTHGPGISFFPGIAATIVEDQLWTTSVYGDLCVANVDTPEFPEDARLQCVADGVHSTSTIYLLNISTKSNIETYLLLARRWYGVDLWRIDTDSPYRVTNFLPSDPESDRAAAAVELNGYVFVAMGASGKLHQYQLTDLLSDPPNIQPVNTFTANEGFEALTVVGDRLISGGAGPVVTVFDFSDDPAMPYLETVSLEPATGDIQRFVSTEKVLAVQHQSGVSLLDWRGLTPIAFMDGVGGSDFALLENRVYEVHYSTGNITKRDISDPLNSYIMGSTPTSNAAIRSPHIRKKLQEVHNCLSLVSMV